MSHTSQANALGKEALQLWEAGQLGDAADRYEKAIALVGTGTSEYFHSALAGVLKALGRHDEATAHYERALQAELAQGETEMNASVKVARHFLASHLTEQGQAERALQVLAPSVAALPDDWLVRSTQAQALFALGRTAEARSAAEQALAHAGSEAKREQLAEHLRAVLKATP